MVRRPAPARKAEAHAVTWIGRMTGRWRANPTWILLALLSTIMLGCLGPSPVVKSAAVDLELKTAVEHARLSPASAEAHYDLGGVLYKRGRFSDALASFRRSEALAPSNPLPLVGQASCYAGLGKHERAEALWLRLLRSLKESRSDLRSKAWLGLGDSYWGQERYSDAGSAYRQSLRLNPQQWRAMNGQGMYELRSRNLDNAEPFFRRVVERSPDAVDRSIAYEGLARIALIRKREVDASNLLRKALLEDPGNHKALELLRAQGRPK